MISIENKKIVKYIDLICQNGGRSYIVGGYIRDFLLGRPSCDIDIEVYGIEFGFLKDLFKEEGRVQSNFGVIALEGTEAEFTIPRKENKIGYKHVDFEVNLNPYMELEDASKRRDFTVNSIMYNIDSGELIDNFNGVLDLEAKVLRNVSDKFIEDPLRVLRGIRFSFELGFDINSNTLDLCYQMLEDLKYVSPFRKQQEFQKMISVDYDNFVHGCIYFKKLIPRYYKLDLLYGIANGKELIIDEICQKMQVINYNKDKYSDLNYRLLLCSVFLIYVFKFYDEEKVMNIIDDIIIKKSFKKILLKLVFFKKNVYLLSDSSNGGDILDMFLVFGNNLGLLLDLDFLINNSFVERKGYFKEDARHNFAFLYDLYSSYIFFKDEHNGSYYLAKGYKGKKIKEKQNEDLLNLLEKELKKI